MNIFYIVLITLVAYSLISTIVYLITDNEDIVIAFGLGIVGLTLSVIMKVIYKIKNLFKYHIGKRSVFEEVSSGNKYKCKTSDTNDIQWVSGYKLIKRYAVKSECIGVPDFSKSFIENSKRNCDRCKYDKECDGSYSYESIKCKHDEYGKVLEFDKFEKR